MAEENESAWGKAARKLNLIMDHHAAEAKAEVLDRFANTLRDRAEGSVPDDRYIWNQAIRLAQGSAQDWRKRAAELDAELNPGRAKNHG